MRLRNSAQTFGWVARLLHWSTAVLIIGLIALGWYMVDLSYFDRWYNRSLALHRAFGIVAFALGVLTLGWRVVSPSPRPLPTHRRWERIGAAVVHYVLLAMVLLLPLTGYLISTSAGKAIDVFGWFELPALIDVGDTLRDLATMLHFYLAYGTAVLVAVHAGAALKHHFIDRDATLARMLWK